MGTYTAFVAEKSNIDVIGARRGTQNTSMLTNEALYETLELQREHKTNLLREIRSIFTQLLYNIT